MAKQTAMVKTTDKWLDLAKQAYEASSAFLESNHRADWDYSLRAFRNEHAANSKYSSTEYAHRSRLYRPKTRSIIRKNEAAGMQAMFNNREIVHIEAENPDDVFANAAAACLKEVVEYRYSRTIPAFEIYLGGLQDAQTTGAVVSYQYWEYLKAPDGRKLKDQPCIELRPIENIRLDGGASWIDPIGTTPYLADIIPMYVCDVRAMMDSKDDKTGSPKWKKFKDEDILQAKPDAMAASEELSRTGKPAQRETEPTGINAYDLVWVLRWFMKDSQGLDNVFYTLGTHARLTDPKPIEEVYFHGKRPYVMGCAVLETHRVFKTPMPILVRPLQQEANDVQNMRLDNVKFVLNKRWLVARGRQTDVQSLVRNAPGGVTLTNDPNTDIKESNWPDVTSSAYVEQDRISGDMDELAGNFSPGTSFANKAVKDTLGGARMAGAGASLMTEYLLRTVNATWWEKATRQIVLLEQHYETDEVILGVCAQKAKLFPRFGISQVSDSMLMKELNVSVDASYGDPQDRFQKFMTATQAAIGVVQNAPPTMNVQEVISEIYANAGYRTGARFWNSEADPRLAKAMQMMQQMQGALKGKQMEIQASGQIEMQKIASNERLKNAENQINYQRIQGDLKVREAEVAIAQAELELDRFRARIELGIAINEEGKANIEIPFKMKELEKSMEEAEIKLEAERTKLAGLREKVAAEADKARLELANAAMTGDNEGRIKEVSGQLGERMQGMLKDLEGVKASLAESIGGMGEQMRGLQTGLATVAGAMTSPKRNAKGFKFKKPDGKKTSAVIVEFSDGSSEELPVGSA